MMDIPRFLDLAVDLETQLSKVYEALAERCGEPPIAAQLKALANAEINHANIIRRGRRYYDELPDLFAGIIMNEIEVAAGLEEARILHTSLSHGEISFPDGLRKLLDLEKRFEKIHIEVSVRFTDSSTRRLFDSLAHSDKSQVEVLKGLIESFG
jgi:hypothetical protein